MTTFITYVHHNQLKWIVPYLKQLEEQDPFLFRRIFSSIALNLDQIGYSLHEIAQFIRKNGTESDQNYVFEQWIIQLINQKQVIDAQRYIVQIKNSVIQNRLRSQLAVYYMRQNQSAKANSLLYQVSQKTEKDTVYYQFALVRAQLNHVSHVIDYVQKIDALPLKQRAQREVSVALAQNQAFDEAVKLLNLIEDPAIYAHTLAQLSMAYADHQRFESAYQLIESINNNYYKNMAYSHLAQSLLKINDFKQAKSLLNEVIIDPFYSELVRSFAKYLAKNKYNEDAIKMSKNIKSIEERNELLLRLMSLFGEQDDYHYQLLLIEKFKPDAFYQKALITFIKAYVQNHPSRSLGLLQKLPQKSKEDVLRHLGKHLATQLDNSINWLKKSSDDKVTVFLLTEMVPFLPLETSGTPNINQLIEILAPFSNTLSNKEHLRFDITMAELYSQLDEEEKVRSYLMSASEKLALVNDPITADALLNRIVIIAAEWNYFKIAYSHVFELTTPKKKIKLLNALPLPDLDQLKKYKRYLR